MQTSTKWTIGSLIAVVVLVASIAISTAVAPSSEQPAADGADTPSAVADTSHRLTEPEGSTVTLVEFLDFECEVCGAVYPVIEQLRAEYGDRVTFVVRYFPIPSHLNSMNAAVAVEAAAQQGQFEAMYSRMFETQAEWGEQQDSKASLFRSFAEELGLDMAAYDAAVTDPATRERVSSDFEAGRQLGVSATPTIFVNDEQIELRSEADIRNALNAALAR
ncbi:DsbA family protein [Plantibacter flavus]|uniref:DsbA family protein n=1 Tax=Plantibacter flavus TaxID=150123 RepID=UPI003F153E0F